MPALVHGAKQHWIKIIWIHTGGDAHIIDPELGCEGVGSLILPAAFPVISKFGDYLFTKTPLPGRVEADEANYNLHIMLRLELEIALLEGTVLVKDLPEAWNARMQDYLGVTPPDDARGVLQDIHWSGGMIGYFSTYALGNLISAQLWEKINQDIPDLSEQISAGKFEALLAWLREKIHRHGAKFEPQELVQKVTGSKIDAGAYIRYLTTKFGEIYEL